MLRKWIYALSFNYNDGGILTSTTVNGSEHVYHLSGRQIETEEWSNNLLVYLYDAEGSPIGMQHRNDTTSAGTFYTFWFEKNLQEDVVAVYNSSGTKCVSYVYDAWGNVTAAPVNTSGTNSYAAYNPFRYRGYYFDTEESFLLINDEAVYLFPDVELPRFRSASTVVRRTRLEIGEDFVFVHICF